MNDLMISSTKYNLLYSAFSFPNIFLTLAGGLMVDYLGDRKCLFLFTFGVTIS